MYNNPIVFIDPDGKKILIFYMEEITNSDGSTTKIERSYEYGSKVKLPDNDFVKATVAGIDFLSKNGLNTEINQLVNDERTVPVYFGEFNRNKGESANWNPNSGYTTKTGNKIEPVYGLANELGHQWFRLYQPEATGEEVNRDGFVKAPWKHPKHEEKRGESYNPTQNYKKWDGYNEYITIMKFDNKALLNNGKEPRIDHQGGQMDTSGPFSTDPPSEGPIKQPVGPVANQ